MSRNALSPPDPEVWQAQNLRLISFPIEPQNTTPQNWWRDLIGTDRETRTEKRAEVTEQGVVEGVSLALSIDLLRLQWTAAPNRSANEVPEGPPTIGSFLNRADWFRQYMHRWLEMSPPINRLGFAGRLLLPVETREAGYQMIDRYLRWVDIDPQSTDLLYRINRKVLSRTGSSELYINRLMTWSVGQFSIVIHAEVGQAAQQQTLSQTQACLLELDINTAPNPSGGELMRNQLTQLFDELVDLGVEIATRGDFRHDA